MDIGATIKDQYTIVEHIGRGGMADVWSARDLRLGRMVAIKTIAPNIGGSIDPVALFEREAQTIAQMEHPHILPIYDFGDVFGRLYIAMRFVTGGSLEDRLSYGYLEPDTVLELGDAIARALDYAHDNAVIHLDLKPPNILLDSVGSPYLADFGLATLLDPQGRAKNPGSGTLLYMAPEQLTSETLDHKADIYSFCIMLFHMLAGQLPFDGTQPLALQQLQGGDPLPDVATANYRLPEELNEILRQGTAINPDHRPETHAEIMDDIRAVLAPAAPVELAGLPGDFSAASIDPDLLPTRQIGRENPELLEAVNIYSRARHNWAGGQGRFLLGLTHYLLMVSYYQGAAEYGLKVDTAGYQMLLRGALEYDVDVDLWWAHLGADDRRWVCLHTVRSGTTPARVRALGRLETLSDDDANPVIAQQVAELLATSENDEIKLAAVQMLRTRALLLHPRKQYDVDSDYRDQMLNTMTRLGLRLLPESAWRATIYSPDIDELIAQQAIDADNAEAVREAAARAVGQMRSLSGVRHLAAAQASGQPGALRALAFVRDEAPALPADVTRQARVYAWLNNTLRRLVADPTQTVARFILALLGGWIAMGEYIFITYRPGQALFNAPRWGNTIAVGLLFGLFFALTVTVADELSRRLAGFWLWWQRLAVLGLLALGLAMLTWTSYTWLYLAYVPLLDIMLVAGFALAFGFVVAALLNWRGWLATLFTAGSLYLAIGALHLNYYHANDFSVFAAALIGLLAGIALGDQARRRLADPTGAASPAHDPLRVVLAGGIGFLWAVAIWLIYANLYGDPITWIGVMALTLGALVFGLGLSFIFTASMRLSLTVIAGVTFAALYAVVGWQFIDLRLFIPADVLPNLGITAGLIYYDGQPFAPRPDAPVLYFDDLTQAVTVVLPMAVVMAIGGYGSVLLADLWRGIGAARVYHERGTWFSGVMLYILLLTGLVSVLALFSAHVSPIWALIWSGWAFATFVCALAAWRWAKWGGRGLLICGMVALPGSLLFDAVSSLTIARAGDVVPLLLPNHLIVWGIWAVALGGLTWGAYRGRLWAGIGLLLSLPLWLIAATILGLQGSVAIWTAAHVALVAYVLKPVWDEMEPGRFPLRRTPVDDPITLDAAVPDPVSEPDTPEDPTERDRQAILGALPETVPLPPPVPDTRTAPVPDTRTAPVPKVEPDTDPAPVPFDVPPVSPADGKTRPLDSPPDPAPNIGPNIEIDTSRVRTDRLPDVPDEDE